MIVDLIGYTGMALILIGVYFVRNKKYTLQSDLALLFGQAGLTVNCFFFGAFPPALLNLVCIVLSLNNVRKDLKERKK